MKLIYFFFSLFFTFCTGIDNKIRIKNQEESDQLKSNFIKPMELENKNNSSGISSYHSEKLYNNISETKIESKSIPIQSSTTTVLPSNFENQALTKKNQKKLDMYESSAQLIKNTDFFVQIGAFLNEFEAKKCLENFKNLSNSKDNNCFIKKEDIYYKVQIGPFKSRSIVDNEKKKISELATQFNDAFVINGN